jgi:hypothetical protein
MVDILYVTWALTGGYKGIEPRKTNNSNKKDQAK